MEARHEAIVAGAGPAGLAAAGVLAGKGFQTVLLERTEAVAARWRRRYDGLRLNTMRICSGLPGHRIPRGYGRYPSRDDYVAYLESYVDRRGLDVRFSTALERVDRGEGGLWRLETSAGPMLARHVVVATGYDAVPALPAWAEGQDFPGELIHAADYRAPGPYAGREVLIVGAGNTGVDIAGHLIAAGARVTVAMRTPPNLFPRDLFGIPLQPSGIVADGLPSRVGDAGGRLMQRLAFGNLETYGIPRAPEGFQSKFRNKVIGPAIDDGFVAALKAGRTRVVAAVERLDGADVVLTDGTRVQPEVIICATGYHRNLEPMVGHLGVLRDDGIPINHDGAPAHPSAPRLYFAGFWGSPAGQIFLMPRHARRIGRAAARDRRD